MRLVQTSRHAPARGTPATTSVDNVEISTARPLLRHSRAR